MKCKFPIRSLSYMKNIWVRSQLFARFSEVKYLLSANGNYLFMQVKKKT